MAKNIDVVHGAFLAPMFDALQDTGVSLNALIQSKGLGKFRMRDASAILPRYVVGEFFEHLVQDQGIEILNALSHAYTMKHVPDWGEIIIGRPTILSAIRLAGSPEARVFSDNYVSLKMQGSNAVYTDHYARSPAGHYNWEDVFSTPLALNAFHLACGENWTPERIDLTFDDAWLLDGVMDFGGAEVRVGQAETRFYFDPVYLGSTLPTQLGGTVAPSHVPATQTAQVFALIDALVPETRPSVTLIAAALDMSPRTLERLLAAELESFRGVLKTWRIGRAFDLLKDPSLSIAEISRRLHYSNTSHFDRAFRGWTQMTPMAFRDHGVASAGPQ